MSILNKFNNVEFSVHIKGKYANIPVEIAGFSIKTGESPNEINFHVPFSDRYDENNFPFQAGNRDEEGEIVSVYFYGANKRLEAIWRFQLFIISFTTRGGRRYFTYRGKDPLRNWARKQHVWKNYNNVNQRDNYDVTKAKYGFYWTNETGTVKFQESNSYSKDFTERMGLIDARHAIIDIFYSPKRELLTKGGNTGDYPKLIFDPDIEKYLSTFILPTKNFQQTDILTSILDILRTVNSRFTIYSYSTGTALHQSVMLITMIGKGKKYKASTNPNNSNTFENYVKSYHNPSNSSIVVSRDELSINTEQQIDAVKYKGSLRQYFVRDAWLVPAWDWWNDYDFVVRDSKTRKIISPYINNEKFQPVANPYYPPFMWTVRNSQAYETLRSYAYVFQPNSTIDPGGRIVIYKAIQAVWKVLFDEVKKPANQVLLPFYIFNHYCFDMELFPTDPIHKYRFKRFVAIPSDRPDLISKITPENGWENPDLLRFKNIQDNLVDGKRNDVNTNFTTSLLKRENTSQINIPIFVEAELPNFYNSKDRSGQTQNGTPLEWRQISTSRLEAKNGFFWVSDWKNSSVYLDRSPLKAQVVKDGETQEQPTNSDDESTEPVFNSYISKTGGITGVEFGDKPIWFRSRMRATFYFTKDETLKSKFFGGENDPSAPNWYFDQIFQNPEYNDPWLAGIVTPSDIGVSKQVDLKSSKTRYAILEDTTMIWQSSYSAYDYSAVVTSGSDGTLGYWVNLSVLQSGLISSQEDLGSIGRMYIVLSWPHRDDREVLKHKAKLKLMENINPLFGGTIETLQCFYLGTENSLKGSGNGLGLGYIDYRDSKIGLSGFTISFPGCTTQLEFDTTPVFIGRGFEKEKVTNIRTQEILKALENDSADLSSANIPNGGESLGESESSQTKGGWKDPHKADKPELFYKSGENIGKQNFKIPNDTMNNAQKVVASLSKSVLPTESAGRENVMKDALKAYPEMDGLEPRVDSRSGRVKTNE